MTKTNPWTTTPADLVAAQLETASQDLEKAKLAHKVKRDEAESAAKRALATGSTLTDCDNACRAFDKLAMATAIVAASNDRVERLRR